MTRNIFFFIFIVSFQLSANLYADSPVISGLGGGGRAGAGAESLNSNPAGLALMSHSSSFFHYTKPRITDWNAGGKSMSLGVYDGDRQSIKGGISYTRNSRAIVESGAQKYLDEKVLQLGLGTMVSQTVVAGISGKYVMRESPGARKYIQGDAGVIFPIFADVRGGVSYENFVFDENDKPPTIAGGIATPVGYGILLFADIGQALKGDKKGSRFWSLAGQAALSNDFTIRAAKFKSDITSRNGWSLGASWGGPRFSLDYAFKKISEAPEEKIHVFGISTAM